MPRISSIELLNTPEQPALVIRTRTPVEKLPAVIGESFGAIAGYLGSLGEHPAGVPYVAYHNMDMADLDVEIGFPVSAPLPGAGDIQYAPIPAGRRAFCMYQGPYAQMSPVYGELAAWIAKSGFTPTGVAYELYFNGPEFPEAQLLTQIVMPVQ
jgi:effector-binding domain-containing protein